MAGTRSEISSNLQHNTLGRGGEGGWAAGMLSSRLQQQQCGVAGVGSCGDVKLWVNYEHRKFFDVKLQVKCQDKRACSQWGGDEQILGQLHQGQVTSSPNKGFKFRNDPGFAHNITLAYALAICQE